MQNGNSGVPSTRADEKLAFARLHIDEIRERSNTGSNELWERAHHESAIFHLASAVDAILLDVNADYGLGLDEAECTWGVVRKRLEKQAKPYAGFSSIARAKRESSSWLSLLFEMRHHAAHRSPSGKIIRVFKPENSFGKPGADVEQEVYPDMSCLEFLDRIASDVDELIADYRDSVANL